MSISFTQVLVWILIAAVVGVVGELLARRRAPDGIVGAIMVGLLAIFLIVGVFHFQITGEPKLDNVPLISSIIVAAILVAIWSGFAYRRVQPYYAGLLSAWRLRSPTTAPLVLVLLIDRTEGRRNGLPLSLDLSLVWCYRTSKWLVTSHHAVTHPL